MSAKLLHALTDDNPDLQKQIGCMTGIFQLFDRQQQLITAGTATPTGSSGGGGRRYLPQQPNTTLTSDYRHFSSKVGAEENVNSFPTFSDNRYQARNQKAGLERVPSFSSSSCSSTFSSQDYKPHAEMTSFDQSLRNSQKQQHPTSRNRERLITSSSSASNEPTGNFAGDRTGRQSLDFRDIVKDSMYRESLRIPVNKSRSKDETEDYAMKPRDSPRPKSVPKFVEEYPSRGIIEKPKTPLDLHESLRVLARLREGPWYFSDSIDPPRTSYESKDGGSSLLSSSREGPRFSYDGRDVPRASFDLRDCATKSTAAAIHKEYPRLSLDGRDSSSRSSNFDTRSSSNILDEPQSFNSIQKGNENRRPPSVVAKLMGLEAMLSHAESTKSSEPEELKASNTNKCESPSVASCRAEETQSDRNTFSHNYSYNYVLESPRFRNAEAAKKPISASSRSPIEPAPWKLHDGGHSLARSKSFKHHHDSPMMKSLASHNFTYSEIERRLKDLKILQSEKDLRVLLDVIQGKGLLDEKMEEQLDGSTNFANSKAFPNQTRSQVWTEPSMEPSYNRQAPTTGHAVTLPTRGNYARRTFESPIVIMKPAKFLEKSTFPPSTGILVDNMPVPISTRSSSEVRTPKTSSQTKEQAINPINREASASRVSSSPNRKITSRVDENKLQRPQKPPARSISQVSTKPPHLPPIHNNMNSPSKISGSTSPRLKKQEAEKKTKVGLSSLDYSKSKKQSSRQVIDVGPKGSKRVSSRSRNPALVEDQIREARRSSDPQGEEVSARSDGNISSLLQFDEVKSVESSSAICDAKENVLDMSNINSDNASAEFGVGNEQPSPVSVLDQSLYADDLSPSLETTKNTCSLFKDDDESQYQATAVVSEETAHESISSVRRSLDFSSTSSSPSKKLAHVENLLQKLRRLNSTHDEAATDYIASLCEKTTPDHRYISEILLASGFLLKDLSPNTIGAIQLHSSGHHISPDLFLVLEQTKASRVETANVDACFQQNDLEKHHRKLLFDTVNEVLCKILPISGHEHGCSLKKLSKKVPSGQKLLHEVCAEVDRLRTEQCRDIEETLENLTHKLDDWDQYSKSMPVVVLDVERMIFKDLVDEIVNIEGSHLLSEKPSRMRGQPIYDIKLLSS